MGSLRVGATKFISSVCHETWEWVRKTQAWVGFGWLFVGRCMANVDRIRTQPLVGGASLLEIADLATCFSWFVVEKEMVWCGEALFCQEVPLFAQRP